MSASADEVTAGPADLDVGAVGARVEELLTQLADGGERSAALGEQLVAALLALYGAGLARITTVMREAAPDALDRLADEPLVAGLLAVHDLHPRGLAERVQAALDGVRPFLGSHGGDVTLVEVTDDAVRLRLEGACHGCGSSMTTLEHAVEGAIRAAAPEVETIAVDGAVAPPAATGGLIPLESLLRCPTELTEAGG